MRHINSGMNTLSRTLVSVLIIAVVISTHITNAAVADTRHEEQQAKSGPVIRGSLVYKTYCRFCHGEEGRGNERVTSLYDRQKLMIGSGDAAEFEKMIRKGGDALGRSKYMPPWEDELSDEQIKDIVAYLQVLTNQVERGRAVYLTNCILCHGINGDGKGRAAAFYEPPPTNLILSEATEDDMRNIISNGGRAVGKSEAMPMWSEQISSQEIEDVVQFVRKKIAKNPR